MTDQNYRKSYTQANYNLRHAPLFAIQMFVISVLVGATFGSIAIGIGTFIASAFILYFPMFGKLMCFVFSAGWAFIGFSLFQGSASIATPVATGALAFLIGIGINYSGLLGITDAV